MIAGMFATLILVIPALLLSKEVENVEEKI